MKRLTALAAAALAALTLAGVASGGSIFGTTASGFNGQRLQWVSIRATNLCTGAVGQTNSGYDGTFSFSNVSCALYIHPSLSGWNGCDRYPVYVNTFTDVRLVPAGYSCAGWSP